MCGRVVQKTPLGEIRILFETANPVPNAAPTYNGAPTDTLPVVRLDRDGRRSLTCSDGDWFRRPTPHPLSPRVRTL